MKKVTRLREKANSIKPFRCRYLVAVLENPKDLKNIGNVIRNVNALGVEKVYVIDEDDILPDEWLNMREHTVLIKKSASAIRWSFVKKFPNTDDCVAHLRKNRYTSIVTSPHQKGKVNISLDQGDFTHRRLAVWFGNETTGVSAKAIDNAEICVSIPMFGIIESLNLATCTGIVLYEITKQRRAFEVQRRLSKNLQTSSNQ